jgi:K+-transporting ATPase ATPase C chain
MDLKPQLRPVLGVALVSLLFCGIFFPLLVTGIAQVILPYQANGEVVQANGHPVGSELIAQQFNSPRFLHPRTANESASGVDPDITLADALSQVPRLQEATGIPADNITAVIEQHVEGVYLGFGVPYVNVLDVNLALTAAFPSAYSSTLAP